MSDTSDAPPGSGAPEAPLEPSTAPTPPDSSKTKVWLAIGAIIVVGLGGFFGARALSSNKNANASSNTLPPTTAGGNQNGGGSGFLRNRGTAGKITAINGSTFSVQTVTVSGGGGPGSATPPSTSPGPTVTVKTSGSTTYTVSKSVGLSAIAKGDRMIASGTQGSGGIVATTITDQGVPNANGNGNGFGGGNRPNGGANGNGSTPGGGRGGFFGGGPGGGAANGNSFAFGTVQSVSGNTIVLTTANGTSTVTVGSGATITKTESGSYSDLKVGDTVVVTGTNTNGTVAATAVREGDGGGLGGFGGFGRGGFGGGAPGGSQNGA